MCVCMQLAEFNRMPYIETSAKDGTNVQKVSFLACGHMYIYKLYLIEYVLSYVSYVTGPAKINHVSAKKLLIFSVFALS